MIEATGLRTFKNLLGLSDPALLAQAFANDEARAGGPRLRRLRPDAELYRRRAAGESLRVLASDYGVVHTTLGRHFARAQVAEELKRAERSLRAERRAAAARLKAAREARRLGNQKARRGPRPDNLRAPAGSFAPGVIYLVADRPQT